MKKVWFGLIAALCVFSLVTPSLTEAATYACIPNRNSDVVSCISISDPVDIANIVVPEEFGGSGYFGVAFTPDGSVYVANPSTDAVYVLDPSNGQVIRTIQDVGSRPVGVAASPDGRVYVTNRSSHTLTVIEEVPLTVTSIPLGYTPVGAAVSPDGNHVYIVGDDPKNAPSGLLSVLAADDLAGVQRTVPVGNKPVGVAVSPDGNNVYVTNSEDGTVTVFDTTSIDTSPPVKVTDPPLNVGVRPAGVAVSPDGKLVVVANRGSGTEDPSISTIKTSDYVPEDPPIKHHNMVTPVGVSVTPDGDQIYVADRGGSVFIIHTEGYQVGFVPNYPEASPAAFGNFIGSIVDPIDLEVIAQSDSKITLSWTYDSLDVSGFEICRNTDGVLCGEDPGTCDKVIPVDGANVRSYVDTEDLSESTTYFYHVRAVDSRTGFPYVSPYECASATTLLSSPSGLRVRDANQAYIELSWVDNSSSESGYRIERKKISDEATESTSEDEDATDSDTFTVIAEVGPNVTSYRDRDVEPSATYVYRVQAYTGSDESGYSNQVKEDASDTCFIATAAYGSLSEPHVMTLRRFRDAHLLSCGPGRLFVRTYYKYSPPIADFISQHETLRTAVRIGLFPVVAISYSVMQFGYPMTLAAIAAFAWLVLWFLLFPQGRRRCGNKRGTH